MLNSIVGKGVGHRRVDIVGNMISLDTAVENLIAFL